MIGQLEELDWITVLIWFATRPREGGANTDSMRKTLAGDDPARLRELKAIEALFA